MKTSEVREVFERIMTAKGNNNLKRDGEKYVSPNMQTKFRYFMLGWAMKESNAKTN
jgi:hypothetical protein